MLSKNTYGEFCEKTLIDGTNPCKSNPCYNQGECINQDDISYRCMCIGPYGDSSCKTNTFGICKNNPCQKESICIGNQTDYKCNCIDWTLGKNCEDFFDPCSVATCSNGATCIKRRTLAYECKCANGYTGLRCDQKISDSCLERTCVQGTCELNSTGLYACNCNTNGYEGKFCEIEKCNPKCVHGICRKSNDGSSYSCECSTNYKGQSCAENVCFSGDMMVETKDRGLIQISQLEPNELVKTIDLSSLQTKFTRFVSYLHFDAQITAKYLRIETNSSTLSISHLHLIAKKDLKTNKVDFYHAETLQNDDLIFNAQTKQFLQIKHIKLIHGDGAYAPLTEDGTILVNDILVSCYAKVKNQQIAHFSMRPLIYISKIKSLESTQSIHWYANMLEWLVDLMPSSLSKYIL